MLWEDDIEKIKDESYKFVGVTVKSSEVFVKGEDSELVWVDDIGETAVIEDGDLEEKRIVRKVVEGEIDGVQ